MYREDSMKKHNFSKIITYCLTFALLSSPLQNLYAEADEGTPGEVLGAAAEEDGAAAAVTPNDASSADVDAQPNGERADSANEEKPAGEGDAKPADANGGAVAENNGEVTPASPDENGAGENQPAAEGEEIPRSEEYKKWAKYYNLKDNQELAFIKFKSTDEENHPAAEDAELMAYVDRPEPRPIGDPFSPFKITHGIVKTSKGTWRLVRSEPQETIIIQKGPEEKNTVTLVWEFSSFRAGQLDYKYMSMSKDTPLPEEIANTVPAPSSAKVGDTVKPTEPAEKEKKVEGGTWTFKKFDKEELVVTEEGPNTFVGFWSFKPDQGDAPAEEEPSDTGVARREFVDVMVHAFEVKEGETEESIATKDPARESLVFGYYTIRSAEDGSVVKIKPHVPFALSVGKYYLENYYVRSFDKLPRFDFEITQEQVDKGARVEVRVPLRKEKFDPNKTLKVEYTVAILETEEVDGMQQLIPYYLSDEEAKKIPWYIYKKGDKDKTRIENPYELLITDSPYHAYNYLYDVDGTDYEIAMKDDNKRWFYVEDSKGNGVAEPNGPTYYSQVIALRRTPNSTVPKPEKPAPVGPYIMFAGEESSLIATNVQQHGLDRGFFNGNIPAGLESTTQFSYQLVRFYEWTLPESVKATLKGTPTEPGLYDINFVFGRNQHQSEQKIKLNVLDRRPLKAEVALGDPTKQTTKYIYADEPLKKAYDDALIAAKKITDFVPVQNDRTLITQGEIDELLKKLIEARKALNGKTDAEKTPPVFQNVTINEGQPLDPTSFVKNHGDLPENTKVTFVGEPVLTPGTHTITIEVTYPDGSKVTEEVTYTVIPKPQSEKYPPVFKEVTINEGEPLNPTDFVENFGELPDGTTVTFVGEPDLTPGTHKVIIEVKYPDGSKVTQEVTYTVVPDPMSKKYPPVFQEVTINEGEPLNPTDFVENFEELPDGTTVTFIGEPDLTPGTHKVTIEVTYPDGSKVREEVGYEVISLGDNSSKTSITEQSSESTSTQASQSQNQSKKSSVPKTGEEAPIMAMLLLALTLALTVIRRFSLKKN